MLKLFALVPEGAPPDEVRAVEDARRALEIVYRNFES
jgi:hypothetical protein